MKKILFTVVLLAVLSANGNAQLWKMRRYELSGGIGTTQFFGDIGGYSKGDNLLGLKDISLSHTRFNLSAAARYKIVSDVSVRVNLAFGSFHSTDARGSNENRGFESKTIFFESTLIGEFYFIKSKAENSFLLMKGSSYPFPKRFFPMVDCYVFSGIGGLSYNVKPNEKLEPYMTVPGGFVPVIPVGLGANLTYSGTYNFGVELGARYSFSDNIDGYSSIYSKSNDMYYLLNFNFTYKIRTTETGKPMFRPMGRR